MLTQSTNHKKTLKPLKVRKGKK